MRTKQEALAVALSLLGSKKVGAAIKQPPAEVIKSCRRIILPRIRPTTPMTNNIKLAYIDARTSVARPMIPAAIAA